MKIKLAFLSALTSVGIQIYLAFHYYGLHYGLASVESVCNLSSKFNCDAVSASPFAQMGGVPIALWGAAANFLLVILLLGWIIRWAENMVRLGAMALLLSSFIALVSVAMAAVSTLALSTYCIFCISAYVLSFIQFELIRRSQDPRREALLSYIKSAFTDARVYLGIFISIPVAAFFFHFIFVKKYGAEHLDRMVRDSVAQWQSNPQMNFTAEPSMSKGDPEAEFVITEFADFTCGHCKNAAPSLSAFVTSRPNVKLNFYTYPLDGTCNDQIKGGDGLSCYLSKVVYCAAKSAQKGWQFHDGIFVAQDQIIRQRSLAFAKETVARLLNENGIDSEAIEPCVADAATDEAIRAQAKAGFDAKISGTPAIFVNGRLLPRGQLIPVMEAAYQAK